MHQQGVRAETVRSRSTRAVLAGAVLPLALRAAREHGAEAVCSESMMP